MLEFTYAVAKSNSGKIVAFIFKFTILKGQKIQNEKEKRGKSLLGHLQMTSRPHVTRWLPCEWFCVRYLEVECISIKLGTGH